MIDFIIKKKTGNIIRQIGRSLGSCNISRCAGIASFAYDGDNWLSRAVISKYMIISGEIAFTEEIKVGDLISIGKEFSVVDYVKRDGSFILIITYEKIEEIEEVYTHE